MFAHLTYSIIHAAHIPHTHKHNIAVQVAMWHEGAQRFIYVCLGVRYLNHVVAVVRASASVAKYVAKYVCLLCVCSEMLTQSLSQASGGLLLRSWNARACAPSAFPLARNFKRTDDSDDDDEDDCTSHTRNANSRPVAPRRTLINTFRTLCACGGVREAFYCHAFIVRSINHINMPYSHRQTYASIVLKRHDPPDQSDDDSVNGTSERRRRWVGTKRTMPSVFVSFCSLLEDKLTCSCLWLQHRGGRKIQSVYVQKFCPRPHPRRLCVSSRVARVERTGCVPTNTPARSLFLNSVNKE